MYIGGAILFGVGMFPYFWLLNTGNPLLIILAMIAMIALANYSMFPVQAAYFAELFNSATRVTAISMSREISSIFAGGAGAHYRQQSAAVVKRQLYRCRLVYGRAERDYRCGAVLWT